MTNKRILSLSLIYLLLGIYALTVFYPIFLMVITSFKTTRGIFTNPFGIPKSFNFESYIKLMTLSNYPTYFKNSIFVIIITLAAIVFFAALAAYILARYDFKYKGFLYLYFVAGMIIPIKLGTISILKLMISIHLFNTLWAIVLVFTAFGIPFGVFILTDYIKMIPDELSNAARIDGCSESGIFFRVIAPLLKPAMAAVAIVTFIPVWNEFWFPLILLKSESVRTIPLATALLFGQYQTNYGLVFAVLTMASIPVIAGYLFFSKYFIKGMSAGALKG